MTRRPEAIAIIVLLGLIIGAGLLSRASAAQQRAVANNINPTAVFATLEASPTPPPEIALNAAGSNTSEADFSIVLPTLDTSASGTSPNSTPLAAFADEINRPELVPTSIRNPDGFNPPPFQVPLAINPNDHFWFNRPLDSNKTNAGLITYPFGSNGSRDEFRIHHGIDIPNPTGTEILAAADGTVIWANTGLRTKYEYIGCYANVVVIEHDAGYQGETLYTLYAHLFALLVSEGQEVRAGQPVALTGSTGCSTGPHLHFEVRVSENGYNFARNPVLWMAPYAGTGVIVGKVAFPSGNPIQDAPINVIDLESGRTVYRTGTYAGPGVQPDPAWEENFAIGDLSAGQYLVTSYFGETTWAGEVSVVPGTTAWVEMVRFDPEE